MNQRIRCTFFGLTFTERNPSERWYMPLAAFFEYPTPGLRCVIELSNNCNENGYYYQLSILRQHRPWSRRYGTKLIDNIRCEDVIAGARRPTRKDARVRYEWSSAGDGLISKLSAIRSAPPKCFHQGYGKGRGATDDTGTLVAAFDGKHGLHRHVHRDAVRVSFRLSVPYF